MSWPARRRPPPSALLLVAAVRVTSSQACHHAEPARRADRPGRPSAVRCLNSRCRLSRLPGVSRDAVFPAWRAQTRSGLTRARSATQPAGDGARRCGCCRPVRARHAGCRLPMHAYPPFFPAPLRRPAAVWAHALRPLALPSRHAHRHARPVERSHAPAAASSRRRCARSAARPSSLRVVAGARRCDHGGAVRTARLSAAGLLQRTDLRASRHCRALTQRLLRTASRRRWSAAGR
jgi:hypothetical protein